MILLKIEFIIVSERILEGVTKPYYSVRELVKLNSDEVINYIMYTNLWDYA